MTNDNDKQHGPKVRGHSVSKYRRARRDRLTKSLNLLRERVSLLEMELNDYTSEHFRVCIFGSARIKEDDEIYKITEHLAYLLGEQGVDLLTGGGHGLMGAANKGVVAGREAFGTKSWSYGISVDLNKFESLNEHLDIKHHHKKFSSRLDDFMRLSNCVVATPGGIGTLLEIYYTWQLLQLGIMSERPLILLKKSFWQGIIDWMRAQQLGNGLVWESDFRFVHIVDTPEEAMVLIKEAFQSFKEKRHKSLENQTEK
ncbi:MAG: LOG family protein [Deltaproteobacteria bacterium]|nr:LOG family protein [Deltaproteobacteria bacterium]